METVAWLGSFLFMQGVSLAHVAASPIVQQNTAQTVKRPLCESYSKA